MIISKFPQASNLFNIYRIGLDLAFLSIAQIPMMSIEWSLVLKFSKEPFYPHFALSSDVTDKEVEGIILRERKESKKSLKEIFF